VAKVDRENRVWRYLVWCNGGRSVGITVHRVLCPVHTSDNMDEHGEGVDFGAWLQALNMFPTR